MESLSSEQNLRSQEPGHLNINVGNFTLRSHRAEMLEDTPPPTPGERKCLVCLLNFALIRGRAVIPA